MFKEKNKVVKPQVRLSTQFGFLTSMLICVVVLIMAGYSIIFVKNLSNVAGAQAKMSDNSIYSLIFQLFAREIPEASQKDYHNITENLVSNRLIAYLIVVDRKTNKISWTSIHQIAGHDYDEHINKYKSMVISSGLEKHQGIYELRNLNANYMVIVGFYSEPLFKTNLDIFIDHMTIMLVIFIFASLAAAAIMSRIVIGPLNRLSKDVKMLADDMSYRLPPTLYFEMNELVEAYNDMAHRLEDLYSSLEHKVKERTLELEKANDALKDTQAMMVHSEKMRSLGELVAGITHEINNPVNFIYGNLSHLTNYANDLISAIDKMSEFEEYLPEEEKAKFEAIKEEIDFGFLKTDLPDLIRSCKEGTERTKNIVLDLKNFSRLGEKVINDVDLRSEIDTTLNILHNKYKSKITVHKEYGDSVPIIEGYGGQLNQVFMNILDNAAYAIKEKGDVYIRINKAGENVVLEFEDTGSGIEPESVKKVFDPFFTTKPVGQGTGLGMSISYRVIKAHNGTIEVESELGKGTKFTITIPIKHKKEEEEIG